MASWQAYGLDAIMRYQIKRRLHGVTELQTVRDILAGATLPVPRGITFRPDVVGGIAGEWVAARGAARARLLYLHGGGYIACSPKTHRSITAAYAQHGFEVFVPEYRLAPEHPFPAAIDDAQAAWNGLLERGHAAGSLSVSGDSAGGGLALALLLALRDKGAAMPAAAALLSPWIDMAASSPSIESNARRDAMFTKAGLITVAGIYLAGADPHTPLASPLYADPVGLPPLLIHVGERELMRDEGARLAERAKAAGVTVDLRVWRVVPHVWQLAQFVPEARASMRLAAAFLHDHAASGPHLKAA